MKKHNVWAHSKARPFICQVCGKSFKIQTQLSNHIKVVHNKIRRFECTFCHMKFGQKTTLEKHVARIHEKQKHTCKNCGKVFTWIGSLKSHLKKEHGLEQQTQAMLPR